MGSAHHDFLTGLDNRPRFHERLGQALATAGTKAQVALLSLDLDEFKEVNDTRGHPFGDGVLKQVAPAAASREPEGSLRSHGLARIQERALTMLSIVRSVL